MDKKNKRRANFKLQYEIYSKKLMQECFLELKNRFRTSFLKHRILQLLGSGGGAGVACSPTELKVPGLNLSVDGKLQS